MKQFLFVAIAVLFSVTSFAQATDYSKPVQPSDTSVYRIETRDGSVFIGRILSKDSINIEFVTLSNARIKLAGNQVSSMVLVAPEDIKDGKYWFPNPNATRYFFGPTAIPLKKGEGYYQNTYLLLNSVNVGVTDNISIGGGVELISLFSSGSGGPIFFFTPKVGFKMGKNFHAGGGLYIMSVPDVFNEGRENVGIAYGVGTIGNSNSNMTLGAGMGFTFSGEGGDSPILTLSGMHRVSRKTALVTENWFFNADDGYYGLYSYGVRFFGEKLSVDLGFINNADIMEGILIGVPYVDFVVKF